MSMKLFYDSQQGQFVFPSLDATNFEINNVPVTGITGGSTLTSITCNDGSINVGSTAGGYVLSGAGQLIGTTGLNMNNNSITRCASLAFSRNIVQEDSNGVLSIANGSGTGGELFTSGYPPSFSDLNDVKNGDTLTFFSNTINFGNSILNNVLTATIANLVVLNQMNQLSLTNANIGNLNVSSGITGAGLNSLTSSITNQVLAGITGSVNKKITMINDYDINQSISQPIPQNGTGFELYMFNVSQQYNYISFTYNIQISNLDITGSGFNYPLEKHFILFLADNNNMSEITVEYFENDKYITYNSNTLPLSISGTVSCYISGATGSTNLGLYITDVIGGSQFSSVSTSININSYLNGVITMENIQQSDFTNVS